MGVPGTAAASTVVAPRCSSTARSAGNSTDYAGGGVYCLYGSPTLTNCTISGNSANSTSSGGGGICCLNSNPTLANCTITGNSTDYAGGGVYSKHGSLTLTSCTIAGNSADRSGGGVYCSYGSPTLTNCTIGGNSANGDGGGVCCRYSSPILTNCTINGNSADYAGGVCCDSSNPTLTNCTISGNVADNDGGGVYCHDSNPMLTNCILWGDIPQEFHVFSGSPVVTYCNVQGSWDGEGNIDADPQFAFDADFHLMPGSPCIDAGVNDPPGGLPPDDLDGNARPLDGDGDEIAVADMGAYEYDSAALPRIALNSSVFEFSATENGGAPPDQALLLRNCGGGALNWEVTGQPAWLTVAPLSGEVERGSGSDIDQRGYQRLTSRVYTLCRAWRLPIRKPPTRRVRCSLRCM